MTDDSSTKSDISHEDLDAIVEAGLQAGAEAVQAEQFDLALQLYEKLLTTDSHNAEIHNNLGVVLSAKGDTGRAEKFFKSASKIDSSVGIYHRNLGSILSDQKRYSRAIREFQSALKLDPGDVESSFRLAVAFGAKGNLAAYEKQLRSVLNTQPDHFEANSGLGLFLITAQKFEEAAEVLRIACASPNAIGATFANLGNAYILLDQIDQAKLTFEQAVKLEPGNPDFLMGLATVERNLGNLDSAISFCTQVTSSQPENAAARNLRGTIQREQGDFEAALESFEQALAIDNDLSTAKVNRGLLHLLSGNWEAGFSDLEARLKDPNYPSVREGIKCPRWDGSNIQDRTIFLYAEQGYGDTIQNIRFANSVIEAGGKVVVQVQPELAGLLAGSNEAISVLTPADKVPETDVFAPLLSLPYLLDVKSEDNISAEPYLCARPLKKDESEWLESGKINVGINWAGAVAHKEDFKRSIDPSFLTPLGKISGVQYFNLHFGDSKVHPKIFNERSNLRHLIGDFSDSAAIIDNLDLVISVDTATVHLAGALGKTCWALIPFVSDWRWATERVDTPWYESVRLYRQPKLNDWGSVIETITRELSDFVEAKDG